MFNLCDVRVGQYANILVQIALVVGHVAVWYGLYSNIVALDLTGGLVMALTSPQDSVLEDAVIGKVHREHIRINDS